MAPKSKSSASSATKKKQARKAERRQLQQQREEGDDQQEQEELDDIDEVQDSRKQSQTAQNGLDTSVDDVPIPSTSSQTAPAPHAASAAAPSGATTTPAQSPRSQKTGKQLKQDLPAQSKQRGEKKSKKQSKKHKKGEAPPPPRKKQYIPPPKPPRDNVDPVDTYGLGVTGTGYERVSAERVITLRLLNKKDSSSVERGVDELSAWILGITENVAANDTETELQQVAEMLPVWINHLPRLLSHTSRRVRLGSATIQAHLLHAGPTILLNDYTLPTLNMPVTLESDDYISALLCSAFDPDRQVRTTAIQTWQALQRQVNIDDYLSITLASLNSTILEAQIASSTSATPSKLAKMDPDARIALQEDQDQGRNQLAASIDAYTYLIDQHFPTDLATEAKGTTDPINPFEPVLSSTGTFWGYLSAQIMEAAQVRRAVWRCLDKVLLKASLQGQLEEDLPDLSKIVLDAGFTERDYNTQNTLYPILTRFLQTYSQSWRVSSGPDQASSSSSSSISDSDSEDRRDGHTDSSVRSRTVLPAVQKFHQLLQVGFYGNAAAGFPQVLPIVQTAPSTFLGSPSSLKILFASLWAAYTGRAIETAGLQGLQAFTACLSSIVEHCASCDAGGETLDVLAEQVQTGWRFYLGLSPSPSKSQSICKPVFAQDMVDLIGALEKYDSDVWLRLKRSLLDDTVTALQSENFARFDLLSAIIVVAAAREGLRSRHFAQELQSVVGHAAIDRLDQANAAQFLAAALDNEMLPLADNKHIIEVMVAPHQSRVSLLIFIP